METDKIYQFQWTKYKLVVFSSEKHMAEVTLVSKDNKEVQISYDAAVLSPVLKSMLSKPFLEGQSRRVELTEIKSCLLYTSRCV